MSACCLTSWAKLSDMQMLGLMEHDQLLRGEEVVGHGPTGRCVVPITNLQALSEGNRSGCGAIL